MKFLPMEDENRYQRFADRLTKDYVVDGYRLVKKEERHLKPNEYRDEKSQQAVEQNGNTGVHYLYAISNWRVGLAEGDQLVIRNGDFNIAIVSSFNEVLYHVCFKRTKLGRVPQFSKAIELCCEYLENGEVNSNAETRDQDNTSD